MVSNSWVALSKTASQWSQSRYAAGIQVGERARTGLLDRRDVFLVELGRFCGIAQSQSLHASSGRGERHTLAGRRAHEAQVLLVVERHAREDLETGRRDTALVRRGVAVQDDCSKDRSWSAFESPAESACGCRLTSFLLELKTGTLGDEQVRAGRKSLSSGNVPTEDFPGQSMIGLTLRRYT